MFEAGKRYQFRMIEDGEEGTFVGTVGSYEHPLLKLEDRQIPAKYAPTTAPHDQDGGSRDIIPGKIINVTSVHFIGALET